MRGATLFTPEQRELLKISTHTPHAGRDRFFGVKIGDFNISTHTPHAGRDDDCPESLEDLEISTHTPHAGRD